MLYPIAVLIHNLDNQVDVIRPVSPDNSLVRRQCQPVANAITGRRQRLNAPQLLSVPVPGLKRQPVIIDDAHMAHIEQNAAVMKAAPNRFTRSPAGIGFHSVPVIRAIFPGPVGDHTAIFGYKAGKAGVRIQNRSVAVVACQVAQYIEALPLCSTYCGRTRRVQTPGLVNETHRQSPRLIHHLPIAEEGLIGYAPDNNAGMVSVGSDHFPEGQHTTGFKLLLVLIVNRISAAGPVPFHLGSPSAPITQLRPEQQPLSVAFLGKMGMMRVMRAPDKIHAAFLDQADVPPDSRPRYGVAPAGMILMHIRPVNIIMLSVENEALLSVKLEPADAKGGFILIV
ncbi:hypothetical protein D3C75_784510 [compost metagenome]